MVFILFPCLSTTLLPPSFCCSSILHLTSYLSHSSSYVLSHLRPSLGKQFNYHTSFYKDCAIANPPGYLFPIIIFLFPPFYLIHSDVWLSPIPFVSGFCYFVLFTNEFLHYTWIYLMGRKSKVFNHFQPLLP